MAVAVSLTGDGIPGVSMGRSQVTVTGWRLPPPVTSEVGPSERCSCPAGHTKAPDPAPPSAIAFSSGWVYEVGFPAAYKEACRAASVI